MMRRYLSLSIFCLLLLAACAKEEVPAPEPQPQPEPEPAPEYVLTDSVGTGLPVIYLRTKNKAKIASKETWVEGEIEIYGGEEFNNLNKNKCSVRGRGNTTWSWPKKPYALKLDAKAPLLGMPMHKRWVLLANFMDRTLMRNIVALKIGSLTSLDWTPRFRSVELVLNGVHQGNYLLVEQIRADKNRVPVSEKNGYLLELDYHDDNEVQWVSPYGKSYDAYCAPRQGIPFGIKNPDPVSDEQKSFIMHNIDSVASVLYGPTVSSQGSGLEESIDYQSFADYYIVFELMINGELENPGSVYFHLNPGETIKAGPLWDFDWGTLSYNCYPAAKTSLINDGGVWLDRLLTNPEFVSVLKQRWAALKPSLQTIPSFIDSTQTCLEASAAKNFKMWNPAQDSNFNGGHIINGDENLTFTAAVARIKKIYNERLTVLDSAISGL